LDLEQFVKQFHDHLAPRLDTYEQAIYLYIFRHGRLVGKDGIVIGFKSARARMACGIGEGGKPMSESTAQRKLQSLVAKGCIKIVASEREGRRIRLLLPSEIPGIVTALIETAPISIEDMDFFEVLQNRPMILKRDGYHCFYCMRELNVSTYVLEHVVSRPAGNNSYRNLVSACRECNNRKKALSAEEFIRMLYREAVLNSDELKIRIANLEKLRNGELQPDVAV